MEEKNIILIIDDDPLMLGALTSILSPHYHVKAARDGETGLLHANKYDVDLILLDVVMRNMSGYEVLKQLKEGEKTMNIPVIFITGNEGKGEEAKALTSGAVDYIRKPVIPEIVTLRVGVHMQLINNMRIIQRFSLTDGLTGVNNRRCFDQQFESEWNRAARNSSPISMLMLDIDHFKKFNDTHGHLNGDHALKTFASILTSTIQRGSDYVFRWGGEEFAIILPETPQDGAICVAEKVRQNVAATPIVMGKDSVRITISVGVASIIPEPATFPWAAADFCEGLDKALYRAKSRGRNRVEVATTLQDIYK
ncbi:MAG: diguanylate cyclase [Defluviitaleaceae bacterium]|nr:diguanylate cyclase [Defluviitaleaceae bacterium]